MSAPTDELKKELQGFFKDGLVIIVGSGFSAAEGIPGMGALEHHLATHVPSRVGGADLDKWNEIHKQLLSKKGLEDALLACPPTAPLEEVIVTLTVELIEPAERAVLEEVISGKRTLPLSEFLPHANPQPNRALSVVTTNYDRLIEVAAEAIGWAADTLFAGQNIGQLNPEAAQAGLIRRIVGGRQPRIERRLHVQVSKPHGSLDWFKGVDGPLRTSIPLTLPRLVITLGRNKYRKGYDKPFDLHRELGNRAIDQASRFWVLGYGFNDDHLETHLSERLRSGTPCLTLVKTLSENAKKIISQSAGMLALSEDPASAAGGFICTKQTGATAFSGPALWQLSTFTKDLLKS